MVSRSFEVKLNAALAKLTKDKLTWACDRKSFVRVYQSVLAQLDTLTPHQQKKFEECLKQRKIHIMGIAGSGKTFLALAIILHYILEFGDGPRVLFISRNIALCAFLTNWLTQRMLKEKRFGGRFTLVVKNIQERVRVLHEPFDQVCFSLASLSVLCTR